MAALTPIQAMAQKRLGELKARDTEIEKVIYTNLQIKIPKAIEGATREELEAGAVAVSMGDIGPSGAVEYMKTMEACKRIENADLPPQLQGCKIEFDANELTIGALEAVVHFK